MKVAEENAPIKYGIQLCDSEKVVEQILENDCKNVVQTRLRYNPKTKEHFIDMIIKVPTTSEDKEGEVVVGGTDVGNTPLCTFYNGSTGIFLTKACWTKTVAEICSKRKKLPSWRSSSKNVVDRAQQNSKGAESRKSANAQTMVSGEANVEEEIRESARQFTKLQNNFFLFAKKGYENIDVLVHNKLDSKRTYVESSM